MINEWIKLGCIPEEAAELEKLSLLPSTVAEFEEITDSEIADMFGITTEEMYKEIEEGTFVCTADLMKDYAKAMESKVRVYEFHLGDVLYFSVELMKKLGYYYELNAGDPVYIYPENNSIREDGTMLRVSKVFKEKKYPNKKWWQFWIKQEETVIGYHLMVV